LVSELPFKPQILLKSDDESPDHTNYHEEPSSYYIVIGLNDIIFKLNKIFFENQIPGTFRYHFGIFESSFGEKWSESDNIVMVETFYDTKKFDLISKKKYVA